MMTVCVLSLHLYWMLYESSLLTSFFPSSHYLLCFSTNTLADSDSLCTETWWDMDLMQSMCHFCSLTSLLLGSNRRDDKMDFSMKDSNSLLFKKTAESLVSLNLDDFTPRSGLWLHLMQLQLLMWLGEAILCRKIMKYNKWDKKNVVTKCFVKQL